MQPIQQETIDVIIFFGPFKDWYGINERYRQALVMTIFFTFCGSSS